MRVALIVLWICLSPLVAFAQTNWCTGSAFCTTVEDGSGLTVTDISGNGNDATFTAGGNPDWTVTVPSSGDGFEGTSAWAIDQSGSSNQVTVLTYAAPELSFSGTDDYGLVMWVAADSATSAYFATQPNEMFLRVTSSKIEFILNTLDTDRVSSTANIAVDGSYEHIAGTYDGTDICVYLNGVSDCLSTTGTYADPTTDFEFGQNPFAADLNGRYDEIALLNVAPTSTQVNNILEFGLVQGAVASTETYLQNVTLQNVQIQ